MSKKTTKSGRLTSIKGGKGGGGNGISNGHGGNYGNGDGNSNDHANGNTSEREAPTAFGPSKVIDFTSARAQRNLDNRRAVERFFLQHMIDVYCEIDGGQKQLPIEIVEVSETGCSFRLTVDKGTALPRDTTGALIPILARFYFSRDSYLRIGFSVINVTQEIGSQGKSMRYGCRVDETFASAEAYRQFARFMEQFARHAMRDAKQASGL